MTGDLLDVRGLTFGFPTGSGGFTTTARDVTFSVSAGRTLGLVGESGSGKSLTLRALMGLLPYPGLVSAGSVRLDNVELLGLSAREWVGIRGGRVAMVLQDPTAALNPVVSVGDQLIEVLTVKLGLDRRAARRRAVELLELVGIRSAEGRLKAYPHEFSGGMRQRVMIAMAVACRPQLLLADEPTTALDVTVQAQILQLLAGLRDELNMGMVIVSHDIGVISELCDDVAVMYAGRIVEYGDADAILSEPSHPYTAALVRTFLELGEARVIKGRRLLSTVDGQPPISADQVSGCSFGPRCPAKVAACDSFDMHLQLIGGRQSACLVRQGEQVAQ